jgi:hypothetical protein
MSRPSASIVGIWLHSQEEDRQGARVYRPRDYAFPPTRGRSAVEFRSDGTYIEYDGGPDDRGHAVVGGWHDLGGGRVQITMPSAVEPTSTRQVLSYSDGMLVIEK